MERRDSTMFPNNNHLKPIILDPSVQNRGAQNGTVVETPYPFPPWNLHQVQSSESYWLNQIQNTVNPTVGVEAIESAMKGLNLSTNHYSRDLGTNLFIQEDCYLSSLRMRAAAAAAAAPDWRMGNSFEYPNWNRVRLLECYRLMMQRSQSQVGRCNFNSLDGVRRRVVSMAEDQYGCRLLQRKIDVGTPEEIGMILSEVKDHLHELMRHPFGNHVVQKIFEARTVTVDQKDAIFSLIIQDMQKLKYVCVDKYGSRAMQRMLELNVETQDKLYAVLCAFHPIILILVKNDNGANVIEHCVKLFPPAYQKVILDEVAMNCIDIATDKSGSTAIQNCLGHVDRVQAIFLLVKEIIVNAAVLAEDKYGFDFQLSKTARYILLLILNYAVKVLVGMKMPTVNASIISGLRGKYVQLSMNKFGSHVVEDLLQFSGEDAAIIIREIIDSREFLNVLQHPYGNFVAQKALNFSTGLLHKSLRNTILSNYGNLHSHIYGKKC
ncbi:pumilio homolog 12-like [Gastrolobium bilobum]|uniref:pumilio homolog 12-like n=1 Tax=Gastrolobium bilobum TaxID=150636 RepID=UPI002AB02B78|nr:pumilio homolog 12-like [Gastrolobium bilobum]